MSKVNYQYDVFLSYAHIDNSPILQSKMGWVSELDNVLEKCIAMKRGKHASIWRDRELRGDAYFDDSIAEAIRASRVFVLILSPACIHSDYCRLELETFSNNNQVSIQDRSRIFKVCKTEIPLNQHPKQISKSLGYPFYRRDPESQRLIEYHLSRHRTQEYFIEQTETLARDISEVLDLMDAHNFRHQSPSSSSSKISHSQSSGMQVFLAAAARDKVDAHTKIRSELGDRGHRVLPEGPLPIDYEDFVVQAREGLSKARISVHMVGDRYGFVPDGGDGVTSVVELHNRIAAEQSGASPLQRLIWWPEGEGSNRVKSQAAFLRALQDDPSLQQGAEFIYGSVEDLKTAILDKIEDIEHRDQITAERAISVNNASVKKNHIGHSNQLDPSIHHNGPTWVYLLHSPGDDGEDDILMLEDTLFEQNFEVRKPLYDPQVHESERREAHEENLRDCDACLIYYGSANERWVQKQLSDVRRSKFGRVVSTPLRSAVYVAPPFQSQKQHFRTRMAQIVHADAHGRSVTDFLNNTQREQQ